MPYISICGKQIYYEEYGKRMLQKAYERSKVLKTFTLSVYDGQGFGYILNPEGDILLRSVPMSSSRTYDNVFDALSDTHSPQADMMYQGVAGGTGDGQHCLQRGQWQPSHHLLKYRMRR